VSVRTITLGPLDGGMYAVTSGLKPGDRVVVDGIDRLRDGAKVMISAGGEEPPGQALPGASEPPAKTGTPGNTRSKRQP
jgi:multidrug efflux system membrane fusion protein